MHVIYIHTYTCACIFTQYIHIYIYTHTHTQPPRNTLSYTHTHKYIYRCTVTHWRKAPSSAPAWKGPCSMKVPPFLALAWFLLCLVAASAAYDSKMDLSAKSELGREGCRLRRLETSAYISETSAYISHQSAHCSTNCGRSLLRSFLFLIFVCFDNSPHAMLCLADDKIGDSPIR